MQNASNLVRMTIRNIGCVEADGLTVDNSVCLVGKNNAGKSTVLTAYADREDPVFKQIVSNLAWDTSAWFVSEPDNVSIFTNADEAVTPQ